MFQELVLTGVSVRQMPTFGPTRSLLSHEVATSVDDIVIGKVMRYTHLKYLRIRRQETVRETLLLICPSEPKTLFLTVLHNIVNIAHDVSFDKIAPDSHTLILCEYFCACLVICLVIWLQ